MPKGLKSTSSVVSIGFSVTESAPNIYTEAAVDLNLSPLDREVFVILAINLDGSSPDAIAATNTEVRGSLTSTSFPAMPGIADANTMARRTVNIRAQGFVDGGVGFSASALETPPATLDYIGIIATTDFFVQVEGTNNLAAKTVNGKMYGYRAKADAAIYAALVQSEVLSA